MAMSNIRGPICMATTSSEYTTNYFMDFEVCIKMRALLFNKFKTLAGLDQCA